MNSKIKTMIWGREVSLNVIFQNYPGEDIIPEQKETAESIPHVDFEEAKNAVEQYVMKQNIEDLSESKLNNIFSYIKPKCFLVPRLENKHVFAIMCEYRFDMEHGLAIVFEDGICKTVGPQDIIL